MNEKLIEAQDIILGRISQTCRKLGLNNIMAQLYVILYISDKPMSLNGMVERLKISKASVSVNIRALERYGVVRKIWVKGSRQDYYEAEMDIVKVVMERVKSTIRDRLSEVEDMINSSYHVIGAIGHSTEEEREAIAAFKEKIDTLRSLLSKTQSAFSLLNSGFVGNILNSKIRKDNKKEVLLTE